MEIKTLCSAQQMALDNIINYKSEAFQLKSENEKTEEICRNCYQAGKFRKDLTPYPVWYCSYFKPHKILPGPCKDKNCPYYIPRI
ncbi:MAG: hypothetical protein QW625_01920 [Candidatus Nanoarchaeia archaeon]